MSMKPIITAWGWLTKRLSTTQTARTSHAAATHSAQQAALDSIRAMLQDKTVPQPVRQTLHTEYRQLERLLDKLEKQQLHVAAVGRVSSGKSSLLNALLQQPAFSTSVVHGETRQVSARPWRQVAGHSVLVVDTPGSDEANPRHSTAGSQREALAWQEAQLADILLFVLDGDLTASQLEHLRRLANTGKPLIVVLNKADLYTETEQQALLQSIREKTAGLVTPEFIVTASAAPRPHTVMREDPSGRWHEHQETPPVAVDAVKQAIARILRHEGHALGALHASLFAGQVAERMAGDITRLRAEAAEKTITTYALAKAVAVAFNPIPVADVVMAAGIDIGMIHKLSRVYGLPLTRTDAGKLAVTISAQLAALLGTAWGINLASAALKTVSAGLSTTLTAASQGTLAYYASYLLGKMAQDYFHRGKSWGPHGPKTVAKKILASLDRDQIMARARNALWQQLKRHP